jgi:hypothetical protein
MTCPDCGEVFPSDSILHRHRLVEHAESVEGEATERAERKVVQEQDDRVTSDGFLKANHRRSERPSIFPEMPRAESPLAPWDQERGPME